jgi:hypothetical protein
MIRTVIALVVLQVAPPLPDPIDAVIEKVAKLRAQRAELQKQEDDLILEARKRYSDLGKKLDSLGAAPTPPAPADKLAQDLGELYKSEASAAKKVQVLTLAALYKQAAKEAHSPQCETCEDLAALILSFVENAVGLGPDALKPIRARVLAELKTVAPNLAAPLNDQLRAAIDGVYSRAAVILEGAAK